MKNILLFNKAIEEARRLGARGGRARARNWRARKRALAVAPVPAKVPVRRRETVAEAIVRLDAAFPWLRGTEHSRSAGLLSPN
jgi:hypothetical protein